MAKVLNTVSAYRSLLQDEDNGLKELGIKKLLQHINLHWIDIANDINHMYTPSYPVNSSTKINPSKIEP